MVWYSGSIAEMIAFRMWDPLGNSEFSPTSRVSLSPIAVGVSPIYGTHR